MTKKSKTYGSANTAREAWVEPGDLARRIANIGGKKRKGRRVRTTGDDAPTAGPKQEAAQDATQAEIVAPAAQEPIRPTTPAPGTLAAVAEGYLSAIQTNGRSAGTAASYRADLAVALKFLGADTAVADLTGERVREFFADRRVTHTRAGKPKNPVTVAKTRRILRLALCWAAEEGMIAVAPIPTLDAPKA